MEKMFDQTTNKANPICSPCKTDSLPYTSPLQPQRENKTEMISNPRYQRETNQVGKNLEIIRFVMRIKNPLLLTIHQSRVRFQNRNIIDVDQKARIVAVSNSTRRHRRSAWISPIVVPRDHWPTVRVVPKKEKYNWRKTSPKLQLTRFLEPWSTRNRCTDC